MISVVIPAHDEATVIGRCLEALCDGARPGELEIVVACNGCRDATADVARGFGDRVRVLETPEPSKARALRLGDGEARGFPRFYIDADVVLPLVSLRRVAERLAATGAPAAAPRMEVELDDRSWLVRAYYDIWTRLPYHRDGTFGSGVYAVSETGRGRFETFPDLIADDQYVRLHFSRDERLQVDDAVFRITPPRTLGGVVQVKTRSQKGGMQLRRLHPELYQDVSEGHGRALVALAADPRCWPRLAVYLSVVVATKLRARWLHWRGDLGEWERDESSRAPTAGGTH